MFYTPMNVLRGETEVSALLFLFRSALLPFGIASHFHISHRNVPLVSYNAFLNVFTL
ncbi:hypothetical protein PT2222_130327 [Paraburkholderia tropica]